MKDKDRDKADKDKAQYVMKNEKERVEDENKEDMEDMENMEGMNEENQEDRKEDKVKKDKKLAGANLANSMLTCMINLKRLLGHQ